MLPVILTTAKAVLILAKVISVMSVGTMRPTQPQSELSWCPPSPSLTPQMANLCATDSVLQQVSSETVSLKGGWAVVGRWGWVGGLG